MKRWWIRAVPLLITYLVTAFMGTVLVFTYLLVLDNHFSLDSFLSSRFSDKIYEFSLIWPVWPIRELFQRGARVFDSVALLIYISVALLSYWILHRFMPKRYRKGL